MGESPTDVHGRVFISYRRDDAAYPAGWLFDRLAERFGEEQIFKDVDSIELGDDFVETIGEAVGSTDVLLALIGEKWLTVAGEDGRRRLDDPADFVRLEIEAALARKVRVIPILVEGASMPSEDELPASLMPLARRQALELSPARFASDTGRLLSVLERTLAEAHTAAETVELRESEPPREAPPVPPEPAMTPGWRRRLGGQSKLVAVVAAAVLLALAIVGVLLFSGGSDDAPPAPTETEGLVLPPLENGPVAFISDESGGPEVWSMNPDGSDSTQLTVGFDEVRRPDWSPDGTKVAFASDRGNDAGDFDLWVLDTEDRIETRLTSGPTNDGAPDWSPNGREIAFGRAEPGEEDKDIWIVNAETEELRQVTDSPSDDDAPDWSRRNRIAFETNRDGPDYDIYTLDPAELESDVHQVTANTWDDFFPDWSPDGLQIAYRSNPGGQSSDSDIFTIVVAVGQPQRLTNNSAIDHRPSWSPDGTLIAFDSERGGRTRLYVVPAEGGDEEPLPTGTVNAESPGWGAAP
jgi:Tol biopolymer transport system component